ncbi:aspartate kinase [Winogradskyella sp.]|uniref:aspartate kinase n=1 Tax=Winogradskyella sp. TaxID=1883156 RepID=UPI0025FFB900|nr:aspartate kinase [Winogradskyella sp.]
MKTINIVLFGIGNVGSTLIHQIEKAKQSFNSKGIDLNIPVITNSRFAFFNDIGDTQNWKANFEQSSKPYDLDEVIEYGHKQKFTNLIAVDVTSSADFAQSYIALIQNGFHIVSANKTANTLGYDFYKRLRKALKENQKQFLYETNVGAGLPIIDIVQNLYVSGDTVHKITGVFSGSLSYIFNRFSETKSSFSAVLNEAKELGFTEPDARDDLSGKDVARKLLILARELGITKEISDVKIESLVPKQLNGKTSLNEFNNNLNILDNIFDERKNQQEEGFVLRYVGELDVSNKNMEVKLISTHKESSLGQLNHTDNVFEIYSESYIEQPLVLKGAGAGRVVTARGVLNDIFKVAKHLN